MKRGKCQFWALTPILLMGMLEFYDFWVHFILLKNLLYPLCILLYTGHILELFPIYWAIYARTRPNLMSVHLYQFLGPIFLYYDMYISVYVCIQAIFSACLKISRAWKLFSVWISQFSTCTPALRFPTGSDLRNTNIRPLWPDGISKVKR